MVTEQDARAASPHLRRAIKQVDVTCPAGTELGGCAVFCGIESHAVDAAHEPQTLRLWCLNDYQACPTWRTARDAELAGRARDFHRDVADR